MDTRGIVYLVSRLGDRESGAVALSIQLRRIALRPSSYQRLCIILRLTNGIYFQVCLISMPSYLQLWGIIDASYLQF